jgi:hypothetical protein
MEDAKSQYMHLDTFHNFKNIYHNFYMTLYLNDGHQIISFVRQNSSHGCDYVHTEHVEAF